MTESSIIDFIAGLAWNPAPSGCWSWPGPVNRRGQPVGSVEGEGALVARLSYRLWCEKGHRLHGELRPNVPLVPACRNRLCVNPFHLDPLDPTTPDPRGTFNRSKPSCPRGHAYSGSNLQLRSSGRRRCRTCHVDQLRRYRERKRDQAEKYRRVMDHLLDVGSVVVRRVPTGISAKT